MNDKKWMFRARRFGWGLRPQTIGGWIFTIFWLILFVVPVEIAAFLFKSQLGILLGLIWAILGSILLTIFAVIYLRKHYHS
ncbi:hypothetical protein D7I46_02660 [Lactococcus allomyrinae]|uniref:Uncharacterized protein n=1 Tax=Lactococcus allomyrinae TaxID=2419773 RepID=A0A387BG21_9LACT|nr:hypothetical protein D7I46_02660 [Lactococcus allomyrinae]